MDKEKILSIRAASKKQHVVLHAVDQGAKCLNCDHCPGFSLHFWRKCCMACRCLREQHDLKAATDAAPAWMAVFQEAGVSIVSQSHVQDGLWVPRLRQRQNAVHDMNASACSGLTTAVMVKEFELLVCHRQTVAGVGKVTRAGSRYLKEVNSTASSLAASLTPSEILAFSTCASCSNPFTHSETTVFAELVSKLYHVLCFKCKQCDEALIDFTYYAKDKNVYCGRCHAESFVPRCAGCDELIFDENFTEADGRSWHTHHFCCWRCDTNLRDKKYVKTSAGEPYCVSCYNSHAAVCCASCGRNIDAGVKSRMISNVCFHDNSECFACVKCSQHLENSKCIFFNGMLLCERDAKGVFVVECARCHKNIKEEFMEAGKKRYHYDCFSCKDCEVLFSTAEDEAPFSFKDEIYCHEHALSHTTHQEDA